jgi:Domain of unknown function (DUF4160)
MGRVAFYKFFRFFFYSYDLMHEPPHLHVSISKGKFNKSAKIWLETLEISEKGDLTDSQVKEMIAIVKNNQKELILFFNDKKSGIERKPLNLIK